MGSPYSPGVRYAAGDKIKNYEIIKAFDPGSMTYTGIAKMPTGRKVFLKKYTNPTALVTWYENYILYQAKLKAKIENHAVAKALCYEMIDFFELRNPNGSKLQRAYYQIFEFVENGMDLKKVITSLRSNPNEYNWEQRVIFAKVMMGGIRAIHDAGIIHTDLKPENLFLVPDDSIAAKFKLRIIDLDNSLIDGEKAPWHDERMANKETYVGTPNYMSPEHLTAKVPTKKSDVFTCAIILNELLGKEHPAQGKNYDEIASGKKGSFNKIPIEKEIAGVSNKGQLEDLIFSCLDMNQARRPTAQDLMDGLNGKFKTTPKPESKPESKPISKKHIEFVSSDGKKFIAKAAFIYGRSHLKDLGPDFERFISEKQFKLTKDESGNWSIEHCDEAKNITNINNEPLLKPRSLVTGMSFSIGKTGKCGMTITLID